MKFNQLLKRKNRKPDTLNLAGGEAHCMTDELELVTMLLTSFLDHKFYRNSGGAAQRITELVANRRTDSQVSGRKRNQNPNPTDAADRASTRSTSSGPPFGETVGRKEISVRLHAPPNPNTTTKMNADQLEKHFTRMGGRIKVERPQSQPRGWRWAEPDRFSLNIGRDRRGEHFLLTVPTTLEESIQIDLLQLNAKQRHLLMLVKSPAEKGSAPHKDRFLCGHDEREWFVAAVPDAVSTISDAMESLKPEAVQAAQARAGLDGKQRQRRRNRAFKRQGEWFFIPVTKAFIDEATVHENEPIARTGGKPHWVQFLYREGGTQVWLCQRHPNGLSAKDYRQLIQRNPYAKGWGWTVRMINPRVLARGEIRHPDHKTIVLHDWHEVLMNRENESRAMRNVDFID